MVYVLIDHRDFTGSYTFYTPANHIRVILMVKPPALLQADLLPKQKYKISKEVSRTKDKFTLSPLRDRREETGGRRQDRR